MPRRRPDAPKTLVWWLDPLAWRLGEAMTDAASRAAADALATFTFRHSQRLVPLLRQLFARDASGTFVWPAVGYMADKMAATPIEGSLPTPLDHLGDDERWQVLAAASLILVAMTAATWSTRIEAGGPRDLSDPSDIVGVDRIRGASVKRRSAKGTPRGRVDYRRLVWAKGVLGKLLGATEQLYGRPRQLVARRLTELVTGVPLSRDEARALAAADEDEQD